MTDPVLQGWIWAAIRRDLLHPHVIAAYLDEFRIVWAAERRRLMAGRADIDRQLAAIDETEERIVNAFVARVALDKMNARTDELAAKREALLADQGEIPDIDPMIAHPSAIADYLRQVEGIARIAAEDHDAIRETRTLLDRLVNFIEFAPRTDGQQGVDLFLHGELATILGFSNPHNSNAADPQADGDCMLRMVAGVGFEPTTFRL